MSQKSPWDLSVRFGDELMQDGFTAIPNLVLDHYAELGITPAEMLWTIHVWEYWWTRRDPYPSLTSIADKMGVSRRQSQRYAESLREKGFLETNVRILGGVGQSTNEYDFTPMLRAIRGHLRVVHAGVDKSTP
jgi:DNA replication protein